MQTQALKSRATKMDCTSSNYDLVLILLYKRGAEAVLRSLSDLLQNVHRTKNYY